MNLRETRRRRRDHPDMEITPLIDIVFLLLIFFVVTTSFSQASSGEGQESQIDVDLPQAATGQASTDAEQIVLFVTADGAVEIRGDVEASGESLGEKLADLQERRPELRIAIKGDEKASHGRMIGVLDEIRRAGFSNVNLVARERGGDSEE
jgi:biopolymer transport protein ExbD